ncbi:MAG TPA: hypothetical protein VH879_03410, partial [Gemmatimonadales bacterium]
MTFAGRLVAGTIVVIIVAILVLLAGADFALRRDLEGDVRATLEREALLVREALPADSLAWQQTVTRMAGEMRIRITLIDRDGRVVAESDEPAETV